MAKSIRSKRKRQMRNIKRVKNAPKELKRLKKCLELGLGEETALPTRQPGSEDVEMKDQQYTVVDAKQVRKKSEAKQKALTEVQLERKSIKSKDGCSKTLLDKNGHYPPWMNSRKIKKHKQNMHNKNSKKKLTKGKGLAW
ncbi:protein LLP homolog [Tubulanus polymorphus]|uniref:protein LLP homolog n=1 Tax=Tubulanus polymorphus TaxID=672921 RepID=UPI003DA47991